jgi:hypothetical protein
MAFHAANAPASDIEGLVEKFETPPGAPERSLGAVLLTLLFDPATRAHDRQPTSPDRLAVTRGQKEELVQVGSATSELFEKKAVNELSREIRDGGLKVIASEPAPGAKTKVVDNAELVNVVIRDRAGEAALCDPNDERIYWKTIRLMAGEIRRRWPAKDAPVPRKAPAAQHRRRTRSDAKLSDAVNALLMLYLEGPPTSIDREAMRKRVEKKIERAMSLSTLDRARKKAWPD